MPLISEGTAAKYSHWSAACADALRSVRRCSSDYISAKAYHRREHFAEAVEYGLVGARGAQRRNGDDLLGDQEMISRLAFVR